MYGDNNNDSGTNQQQPGGNTPPPMMDSPMSSDPVTAGSPPTSLPEPSDPPAEDEQFTPSQPQDLSAPTTQDEPTSAPAVESTPDKTEDFMDTSSSSSTGNDDLLTIKQQALQQLTPLVSHLDQTPKEEFRTTMMMIQATDNQDLVKKAFEAAQKIEDDKERAQAFLDIINEINYFTQAHEQ